VSRATELRVEPYAGQLRLLGGDEATYRLNDWSFTQLCSLAGVSKDTVNRLSAPTARVLVWSHLSELPG
jgi:hypothetical protein